jgi:hypothetical protein
VLIVPAYPKPEAIVVMLDDSMKPLSPPVGNAKETAAFPPEVK